MVKNIRCYYPTTSILSPELMDIPSNLYSQIVKDVADKSQHIANHFNFETRRRAADSTIVQQGEVDTVSKLK